VIVQRASEGQMIDVEEVRRLIEHFNPIPGSMRYRMCEDIRRFLRGEPVDVSPYSAPGIHA